uniref:Uncharacterized protein n=1 Tax=Arundo donax TaxID=35708 RepID=A0A0A9CB00_ARUDO
MYLRLGEVDTIVVSSPAAAQQVLQTNDVRFASRLNLLVLETIFYNNLNIGVAPHGTYWRGLHKLCTLELLLCARCGSSAP